MITQAQMTEQHILEHNSRLLQSESDNAADSASLETDLRERVKKKSAKNGNCSMSLSVAETGPMCICDAVGQSLESLIQIFDRSSRCECEEGSKPRRSVHVS